jgi:hypothetical protein
MRLAQLEIALTWQVLVFDTLIKIQSPNVPTLRVVNMFVNLGLLHNCQGRVEVFGFVSMIP